MTAMICIAGAVAGLVVAALANWLVLPLVLQAQERQWRNPTIRLPFPTLLGDPRRVRALTIAIYRYVMPLIFASVGSALTTCSLRTRLEDRTPRPRFQVRSVCGRRPTRYAAFTAQTRERSTNGYYGRLSLRRDPL
jgi:hypothetical protein